MQELFQLVQKEIMKSGCQNLIPAGLVLTGGGSQLQGTLDCATRMLSIPVRQGRPSRIGGLGESVDSPVYATAVGLVLYGMRYQQTQRRSAASGSPLGGVMRQLSSLLSKFRTD